MLYVANWGRVESEKYRERTKEVAATQPGLRIPEVSAGTKRFS